MNDALHDPPRWKDDVEHGDVAERAVGHAIRCARAVPPRRAPSLARIAAGIRSSQSPRRLTWVVVTAAFILGLATAASAARLDLLPSWLTRIVKAKPQPPAPDRRPPRSKVRSSQTTPVSPSTVSETPVEPVLVPVETSGAPRADLPSAAVVEAPSLPTRGRKVAAVDRNERGPVAAIPGRVIRTMPEANPVAPSVPTPMLRPAEAAFPQAPSAPASPAPVPGTWPWPAQIPAPAESPARPAVVAPASVPPPKAKSSAGQYLSEAVRLMRAEHAPSEALRFLDRHGAELDRGGLGHEALILRLEALLALDRRPEALRLLDGASLSDVAASRALLVTRGQLRAAANRCGDGIGDFDLVLARSRQTDRQALIGRALCRKRLGDGPGSKADVERLLAEFPGQPLPAELAR